LKTVYTFKYYVAARVLRTRPLETQINKVRDGLATEHLAFSLYEAGFSYGGAIINVPKRVLDRPDYRECEATPVPLTPDDLILLTTRPPLDDRPPMKRVIERSGEPIEKDVFAALRPVLMTCTRTSIELGQENGLLSVEPQWRSVGFDEHQGGRISAGGPYRSQTGDDRLTVAYLISIPPTETFPRIVAAFGAGGTETLVFAWLLRRQINHLFARTLKGRQRQLVMTTFRVPKTIPHPFLKFDINDLDPHVVVDTVF